MRFTVVVPNWNGKEFLKKNLPAVLALGADEVVVADDGSTDGSVEFLREEFPEIRLIPHRRFGFAGNCNEGVRAAGGDIIILLNTDVVPDKNLLIPLKKHFSDQDVFAVSFNEKNNEKYAWTKGIFKDGFIAHESGEKDNEVHNTFWASGGSAAFRRSMWMALGGMDRIFEPFYWEDIDLSYRAQKRGWKVLWDPEAKVEHRHEGVIKKNFTIRYVSFIQERNHLLFIWRNLTDKKMFSRHISSLIRRVVLHPAYLLVLAAALSRLPLILSGRVKERRDGKIKDEKIIS